MGSRLQRLVTALAAVVFLVAGCGQSGGDAADVHATGGDAALPDAGCAAGRFGVSCECGPYPSPPDGAGALLYVDPDCASETATGDAESPYATIAGAVTAAAPGATILVAPGVYTESLVIDKAPLSIVGGSAPEGEGPAAVTLRTTAAQAAVMLLGPGGGIGDRVALTGLHIDHPPVVGIWIAGANALVDGCRIEGAHGTADAPYGYGILATGGAAVHITGTTVVGSDRTGILLSESSGTVDGGTVVEDNGGGGIRLEECPGGVTIEDVTVRGNRVVGIGVFSSTATLRGNRVEATTAAEGAAGVAHGVVVAQLLTEDGTPLGASTVDVLDSAVSGNAAAGVLFSGDARGRVEGNTVEDNGDAGVWLQLAPAGADPVPIQANQVLRNRAVGIGVAAGARATVDGNVVGDTQAAEVWQGFDLVSVGDGVGVFAGSAAVVSGNEVVPSARVDLVFDSAAAGSAASGNHPAEGASDFRIVVQNPNPAAILTVDPDANPGSAVEAYGVGEQPFPLMPQAEDGFVVGRTAGTAVRPEQ